MDSGTAYGNIGVDVAPPVNREAPARRRIADIAIVGAGASGALAALVLEQAGYNVAVIDRNAQHPPEFRVEKVAGKQVDMMRGLGLLDRIASVSTLFGEIINVAHGRIIDRTYSLHYGIFYNDLVNFVRAELKSSSAFIVGQVTDIKLGAHRQEVVLADGTIVEARLVVLATGLSSVLRHKLGIERRTTSEKHSISFGFNVAPARGTKFDFGALTYYGERLSDRIDYLNLFPIGSTMRANLFTFRDHRDEWIRDLRRHPEATLVATMPGLKPYLGDFRVIDKVQHWVMDLYVVDNYLRDGLVLIGDAFQTSCPAAGTGLNRVLTDVERLRHHVPQWFASPGMASAKIAQFYDDPVKRRSDASAIQLANYRRSLTIDESWQWRLYRGHAFVRRRLSYWVKRLRRRRIIPAAEPPASAA